MAWQAMDEARRLDAASGTESETPTNDKAGSAWRRGAALAGAGAVALAAVCLLCSHGPARAAGQQAQALRLQGKSELVPAIPRTLLIEGAKWEFTDKFDCWGHDLHTYPVKSWGSPGAEDDRAMCARKCLESDLCVAFNFPSSNYSDPKIHGPQVCYLKITHMHAKEFGMSCEKGFDTEIWTYYTLIEDSVWPRQTKGYERIRWPFGAELELPNSTKQVWFGGTRWAESDGAGCYGETILSKEAASDDECAALCTEHAECIAFEFPAEGKTGKWNASKLGAPECVLKKGSFDSLPNVVDCEAGSHTEHWRYYTLADAWYMRRNQLSQWVRKQVGMEWTGEPTSPCVEVQVGSWSRGALAEQDVNTRRLQVASGATPPCCQWTMLHCTEDAKESCSPLEGYPKGCAGLCDAKASSCHCWSQESAEPASGDCCSSCHFDCGGKASCHPAECGGPEKMCKSTFGTGSTCSCAAKGGNATHHLPADVAAGWSVQERAWTEVQA